MGVAISDRTMSDARDEATIALALNGARHENGI
jgi:hypothetical protein